MTMLRRNKINLITLCTLGLIACTEATADAEEMSASPDPAVSAAPIGALDPYAEFTAVLAQHQAMSARVARVSRRLRVANAPLCTQTRDDIGLSTHELSDYPQTLRPLALHFMALKTEGRFIRSVVPGSPADQARLRAGEEVISGWPVQSGKTLVIDDGYGVAPLTVAPDRACVAPAFVINSDRLNASTDGREIELSTALIKQVGDDAALALIVAHEMAHILRGHTPDAPRWTAELQADADALTLMRNAGYDVAATVATWETGVDAHRDSQAMSTTHPPLRIRLRNLETALATLSAGPDGFRPLPDIKGPSGTGENARSRAN
jgi:hypothetical protein